MAIMATYFLICKGGFHMKKEPMETTILPEIKRRKRKVQSTYAMSNISYQSLFELYSRECKIKGLSDTIISGYTYATRYFLDFAGYDVMCKDITQDLINEYYLHLQQAPSIVMYLRYHRQFCMVWRRDIYQVRSSLPIWLSNKKLRKSIHKRN